METGEHINAGNAIRVDARIANQYINVKGSGAEARLSQLTLFTLPDENGIPNPLNLSLSPGEIVALAGDYYTKAGWARVFDLPDISLSAAQQRRLLVTKEVNDKEKNVFSDAYADLASQTVTQQDIDKIEDADRLSTKWTNFLEKTFSFFAAPIGLASKLITQAYYAITVSNYGDKLSENEAHFAPWSTRAYIIGHQQALEYAEMAKQFANFPHLQTKEVNRIIENAKGVDAFKGKSDVEISQELSQRYMTLAYTTELFTMHFYSDNYAGGHNMRIGQMRLLLPERYGIWGSILVNTMHDFDNANGVWVNNPFQPKSLENVENNDSQFNYPNINDKSFGDGNYVNQDNWGNREELVNGMTNSLGDITRVAVEKEQIPSAANYGGLPFLPDIDKRYPQYQPLMIQGKDGKIYYRKDPTQIKILNPSEYQQLRTQPDTNLDYQELSTLRAMKLVIKLRLLSVLPFVGKFFAINKVSDSDLKHAKKQSPATYQKFAQSMSFSGGENKEMSAKIHDFDTALTQAVLKKHDEVINPDLEDTKNSSNSDNESQKLKF